MAVHGSGEQIRPLIHIRDASAVLRLGLTDSRAEGEIINAVTINPTVNQIAQTLQTITPGASIRYTDQDILTELSFEIDTTKLLSWGFQPQFNLEQGLREMLGHWQGFRPMWTDSNV